MKNIQKNKTVYFAVENSILNAYSYKFRPWRCNLNSNQNTISNTATSSFRDYGLTKLGLLHRFLLYREAFW